MSNRDFERVVELTRRVTELEGQLEAARNTATTYEQMLDMTPRERELFTQPRFVVSQ
jgi:hypothetical protein